MPSDHRLHPASFLFAIAGHLRSFLVPAIAVIFTAGAAGADWQVWLATVIVPLTLLSIVRTLSYRYRLEEGELVVRTGFVFRNERHIPYARIQNIEAIQNVFHRLLGVVEVRVETGGTREDDARMQVVPAPAYVEIRERVFAHRAGLQPAEAEAVEPDAIVVLALPPRELLLSGLIANRSAVVIAAGFGLVWELGLFDAVFAWMFGEDVTGRSIARQAVRTVVGGGLTTWWYVGFALASVFALFAGVTLISMAWAYARLHGFTLRRIGDDLRAEYGLFTRISTTIPLRRIQTLTVFEGPLYRLFGRASVKVATAGGDAAEQGKTRREPLVPIIRRTDLEGFLRQILPEINLPAAEWQPAAPRAFQRQLRKSAIVSVICSAFFTAMIGVWALLVLAGLIAVSVVHARRYTASLGWSLVDNAVVFRRGWVWRRLTAARFSKMQVIAVYESPFDRRTGMARVQVDTAGTADSSDAVNIPYLETDIARSLHRRLAGEASRTSFEW